jgi:hypothetical protein
MSRHDRKPGLFSEVPTDEAEIVLKRSRSFQPDDMAVVRERYSYMTKKQQVKARRTWLPSLDFSTGRGIPSALERIHAHGNHDTAAAQEAENLIRTINRVSLPARPPRTAARTAEPHGLTPPAPHPARPPAKNSSKSSTRGRSS